MVCSMRRWKAKASPTADEAIDLCFKSRVIARSYSFDRGFNYRRGKIVRQTESYTHKD